MEEIALCGSENLNSYQASSSDWFLLTGPVVAALLYVWALVEVTLKNRYWNVRRSINFLLGVSLCLFSFLPSMMSQGHQSIRIHMLQHLVVGMIAPVFLVLGAPLTLALKALPVQRARILTRILKSRIIRITTHPFIALVLNTGSMLVFYLTPLYALSLESHLLHMAVHIHFALAGYLFVWAIIGIDVVPFRTPFNIKVMALLLSIGLHAFLSKFMYAYLYPRNINFSIEEIRDAARLMYYGGDAAELVVVILLFYSWYTNSRTGVCDKNCFIRRGQSAIPDSSPALVAKI